MKKSNIVTNCLWFLLFSNKKNKWAYLLKYIQKIMLDTIYSNIFFFKNIYIFFKIKNKISMVPRYYTIFYKYNFFCVKIWIFPWEVI